MSTNGDAADLIVRETVRGGIQITEFALKLVGLGAKNLAALLIALANDEHKFAGKTTLKRLLRDGEELTIFSIKEEDLAKFQKACRQYGVLFCSIINRTENTGTAEIMAKARDARQINHILEKLGIDLPNQQQEEAEKKAPSRVPSEENSKECGTDSRADTDPNTNNDPKKRPSVRKKMEAIKSKQSQHNNEQPQRSNTPHVFHRGKHIPKVKGGLER